MIPAIPVEIEIPSIGLQSPVDSLVVVDGNIDPGENQEKPVTLVGLGSQLGGPTGSYMGGHSCRGCDIPTVFDHLFDRAAQVALVHVGDVIYITSSAGQRICFTVALVDRVNKDWLGSSDAQGYAAWHDTAGRLVIFTCFQEIDDVPSVDELVIVTDVGYVC